MKAAVIGKGRMGSMICDSLENAGHEVFVNEDALCGSGPDVLQGSEMIIDFSHKDNLDWYLDYAVENRIPVVLGTTALEERQIEKIKESAERLPIFFASNYSLGIALLSKLVKEAALILKDWDIEITEKHHNQKADAPSGTAMSLFEAANADGSHQPLFGRSPESPKRGNEIGMHAIRGGTLAGFHDVEFFGEDESVSLSHNAQSRQIFVSGAIKAAEFLEDCGPGLYDMNSLLEEVLA